MDLLIVESLEDEVTQWLSERHSVRYAPELAQDARALREALSEVRALIIPSSVALDMRLLRSAPALCVVGRVSAGVENIDLDACARARVEVVRSATATAQAEAEFMIGALLALLRRVPVCGPDGLLLGRELGSCTVGLIGMGPAARSLAPLLMAFGANVVGYDPSLHFNDAAWKRWQVEPLALGKLLQTCDAVCVQLPYFSRYQGLLGERFLPHCKPDQVIVSISHSAIFNQRALADVLKSGRVAAVWLDSLEPDALQEGQPLAAMDMLQVTPCVASTTRESRLRSAWAVAQRIDELLCPTVDPFTQAGSGDSLDLEVEIVSP
jgi:phosphoglycerate dehydrogenase-like enzyme